MHHTQHPTPSNSAPTTQVAENDTKERNVLDSRRRKNKGNRPTRAWRKENRAADGMAPVRPLHARKKTAEGRTSMEDSKKNWEGVLTFEFHSSY